MAQARRLLGAAHKTDPNHYQTLYRYALTFSGGPLTENTVNVFLLAQQLAPQVGEIRFATAQVLMARRDFPGAIAMLQPLANDPHNKSNATVARAMIAHARAERTDPLDIGALMKQAKEP